MGLLIVAVSFFALACKYGFGIHEIKQRAGRDADHETIGELVRQLAPVPDRLAWFVLTASRRFWRN